MIPLSPARVDTTVWHGGNEYGGPGAWKRPPSRSKKRNRSEVAVATSGPLDLTAFFGEKWLFARTDANIDPAKDRDNMKGRKTSANKDHDCKGRKTMRRSKKGKAGDAQRRLESLSLALVAPSHGAGASVPGSASTPTAREQSTRRTQSPAAPFRSASFNYALPLALRQTGVGPLWEAPPPQQPVRPSDEAWEEKPEFASPRMILDDRPHQQEFSASASTSAVVVAVSKDPFEPCHVLVDAPPQASLLPKQQVAQSPQPPQGFNAMLNSLRVPSVTIKMSVDDKCNAELLDERATLRALLTKQKQLGEAMRLRRLETCLGTRGGLGTTRKRGKKKGRVARRERRNNNQNKKKLGDGGSVRRDPTHSHPLLFMTEGDVQKVELEQMRLEDAEATHLFRLEEARRRKQDYATYYELASRYGPLTEQEFELAVFPGRRYHARNSDASRVIQNWWWSVWPTMLRRRKAAALAIQSLFRGFVQRRRWYAIIRLRTLWGNTRIAAHAFLHWRDMVVKVRKVKKIAQRLKNRCVAQCFAMLVTHARRKHHSREELLRQRLRKVSEGVQLRVFEGWVSYTGTSLAVERMRRRSLTRPVFRVWGERASEDRRRRRLCSASATIVHRLLGWRRRARYVDLRRVCINMQAIARAKVTWIHRKRKVKESIMLQAEEAVQASEDWRVRRLMDAEQQRRGRLQATIDRDASLAQQAASAFLRTADGKSAVAGITSRMKKEEEAKALSKAPGGSNQTTKKRTAGASTATNVEARKEVARMFARRRQALIRHDFNAASPPPLRCPRPDCGATFVKSDHYVRHAADDHPVDDPGIAELALVMHNPDGLALLESWVVGMITTPGESVAHVDRERFEELRASGTGGTADDALCLWKAIEDWRTVTSSSGDYQQLCGSILERNASMDPTTNKKGSDRFPGEVGDALTGPELSASGSLGTTGRNHATTLRDRPMEYPSDNTLAFAEASWQALVSLNSVVGRVFFMGAPYARYLDELKKPLREAVEAAAADIAKRKRAESLAEARELRAVACLRVREKMVDDFAETAVSLFLQGTTATSFLGDLVDAQAALLSVVIIAERSAFAKIISAVWNEAVDAAAESTARREHREVSPAIADTLSEAASAVARSQVMDQLIDDCVLDLTEPYGELWADARAMEAVADGVGYRVRCDVIKEMLEESIVELQGSGEAEQLMSDAERRGEEGEAAGNALRASAAEAETAAVVAVAAAAEAAAPEEGPSKATDVAVATHLALGAAEIQQEEPSIDAQDDTTTTADAIIAMDISLPVTGGGALASHSVEGATPWNEIGDDPYRGWEGGEADFGNNDTMAIIPTPGMSQEDATVVVQSAWRRKAVYRRMRTLVAQNFVKMYDSAYGSFYWYNQTTGESTWEKPAIIDAFFKPPNITESIDYN